MWIDAVKEAYSDGDDVALVKALDSLQRKLIGDVQCLGPAAMALQLGELRELKTILDKIAAEASAPTAKRLVFVAGFISCSHGGSGCRSRGRRPTVRGP